MYITGAFKISPESIKAIEPTGDKGRIPPIKPSLLGWKKLDRAFRPAQLACMAIGEALKEAKVQWPLTAESENTALLILTKDSNLLAIEEMYTEIQKYGVGKSNPGLFPWTVLNVIGGFASIYFNIRGMNYTLSNEENSGLLPLIFAEDLLTHSNIKRVIICELELLATNSSDYEFDKRKKGEYVNALVIQNKAANLPPLNLNKFKYSAQKSILSQILEEYSAKVPGVLNEKSIY